MEDKSFPVKRQKTEPDYSKSIVKSEVVPFEDEKIIVKSDVSEFVPPETQTSGSKSEQEIGIAEQLLDIETKYTEIFSYLTFEKPIEYVYSPLKYAFELHSQFVRKYCQTQKDILFLGMNPGPWGMSQTGVPFGEVSEVQDWLGISGKVDHPDRENPKRPVKGLSCTRSEISGRRFWAALKKIFGKSPYDVLKNCFVHNYCPIALMTATGKNITPAEIKANEKQDLFRICDDLLIEVLLLLNVKVIFSLGRFAEAQGKAVLKKAHLDTVKLMSIPHPSPRSLTNSYIWEIEAAKTIKDFLAINNIEY